jgi:hypothetical protein
MVIGAIKIMPIITLKRKEICFKLHVPISFDHANLD